MSPGQEGLGIRAQTQTEVLWENSMERKARPQTLLLHCLRQYHVFLVRPWPHQVQDVGQPCTFLVGS